MPHDLRIDASLIGTIEMYIEYCKWILGLEWLKSPVDWKEGQGKH